VRRSEVPEKGVGVGVGSVQKGDERKRRVEEGEKEDELSWRRCWAKAGGCESACECVCGAYGVAGGWREEVEGTG
jgi:hypothetical protein